MREHFRRILYQGLNWSRPYLKYYVGYLNFLDLKEEQQSLLGENFDLKSFHQKILEIGPVQFPVLRKYMNEKL